MLIDPLLIILGAGLAMAIVPRRWCSAVLIIGVYPFYTMLLNGGISFPITVMTAAFVTFSGIRAIGGAIVYGISVLVGSLQDLID